GGAGGAGGTPEMETPAPAGSGGSAGGGTAGAAGSAGASGAAPAAPSGKVSGTVIDYYRQPIPNAQVTIGSATATTDARGAFEVPDAPADYDATVLLNGTQNGQPRRFVWRYEGLTRRDPHLQVYASGVERGAWLNVNIANVDFMRRASGDRIFTSYGGPTGEYTIDPSAASERVRIVWEGPTRTSFTGHAFRMLKPEGQIEASAWYAYDSMRFDVSEEQEARVDYDLAQGMLTPAAIYGSVDAPQMTDHALAVFLRFPDHAVLEIARELMHSGSFNYDFPGMPVDGSVIVVASQHLIGSQFVHADGLTKDSAAVMLELPAESSRLVAPVQGSKIDTDTVFRWTGEAKLFLFALEIGRHVVHVVTSKREARLPLAATFEYEPNRSVEWYVETHGEFASLDDATGPEGYLDTCAYGVPRGPTRGTGIFTESERWPATFAP
ncbi:MAG TPA: carboxypeptidase-like regulatory domain-containing protein, partial [Polyangiales bacterium]|nr:carboxypeptidase-like regulatory domain-containing protein [Polyangiales bacterium]